MVVSLPMIVEKLKASEDEIALQAAKWLSQTDIAVSDRVARPTVHEAAHLWGVRLQISRSRKNHLYGAEALLLKLKCMTPQKQLKQVGFSGQKMTGSVYFEAVSGDFVGAVMVRHADKPRLRPENFDTKVSARSGSRQPA